MNKRKLIISLAGIAFLAVSIFVFTIFAGNKNVPPPQEENGKTAVNVIAVQNGTVAPEIPLTGRVIPTDRVDLFAEVQGVSSYGSQPFKTGNKFRKGQVLVRIDDSELRNALRSAKSQFKSQLAQIIPDLKIDFPGAYDLWKAYLTDFDIAKTVKSLPEIDNEQLKLFLTGRNIYSTFYNLKESEARLAKYTIRAPFDGALTETYINRSSLVRAGQQLGEFISYKDYELEASINVDDLQYFEIGSTMTFTDVEGGGAYEGKLVRINNKVDPNSQLIKVFFQIRDETLRSGLYLRGALRAQAHENALRVTAEALVDASSVFVIEGGKAVQQSVKVLEKTPNHAIISGLKDGAKLIIDNKNSAFAGSSVIEME